MINSPALDPDAFREYRGHALRKLSRKFRSPFSLHPTATPLPAATRRQSASSSSPDILNTQAPSRASPSRKQGSNSSASASSKPTSQAGKLDGETDDGRVTSARPRTAVASRRRQEAKRAARGSRPGTAVVRASGPLGAARRLREMRPLTAVQRRQLVRRGDEEEEAVPLNVAELRAKKKVAVEQFMREHGAKANTFEAAVEYAQVIIREARKAQKLAAELPEQTEHVLIAACGNVLAKLAVAETPFMHVLRPLIHELLAGTFNDVASVQQTVSAPMTSVESVDQLAMVPTYRAQSRAMEAELSELGTEMKDADQRVAHMVAEEGKRVSVLSVALVLWQRVLVWNTFHCWRENVRRIRHQRRALTHMLRSYRKRLETVAARKTLLRWRAHIAKQRRKVLQPEVRSLRQQIEVNAERVDSLRVRMGELAEELKAAFAHRTQSLTLEEEHHRRLVELAPRMGSLICTRKDKLIPLLTELVALNCRALHRELHFVRGWNLTYAAEMCRYLNEEVLVEVPRVVEIPDAALLVTGEECVSILESVRTPDLLLAWVNYHLNDSHRGATTQKATASSFRLSSVHNFSSDFTNSECLLRVLAQIGGPTIRARVSSALKLVDLQERAYRALSIVKELDPTSADLISAHDILQGTAPDMMCALVGRLFVLHVMPSLNSVLHRDSVLAHPNVLDVHDKAEPANVDNSSLLLQSLKCIEQANLRMAVLKKRISSLSTEVKRLQPDDDQQRVKQDDAKYISTLEGILARGEDLSTYESVRELAMSTAEGEAKVKPITVSSGISIDKREEEEGVGEGEEVVEVVEVEEEVEEEVEVEIHQQSFEFDQKAWIEALPQRVQSLWQNASAEVDGRKRDYMLWRYLLSRVRQQVLELYTNRVNGRRTEIVDHREARLRRLYTCVTADEVEDLLVGQADPEHEVKEICGHLEAAFDELRKIFTKYAQGDLESETGTLNVLELSWFARDCHIPAAHCTMADINASVSEVVNQMDVVDGERAEEVDEDEEERSVRFMLPDDDESEPDLDRNSEMDAAAAEFEDDVLDEAELGVHDFIVLLVRIANRRFPDTLSLSGRLVRLLKFHVLRYADRIDAGMFRRKLRRPAFLDIFRRHRRKLRAIFFHFATMESVKVQASWTNTIDFEEFVSMLRACHLMQPAGPLSAADIVSVFDNIEKVDDVDAEVTGKSRRTMSSAARHSLRRQSGSVADKPLLALASLKKRDAKNDVEAPDSAALARLNSKELLYPEFLEGLAAIASFRNPSPFLPLEDRLEYFLSSDFVPNLISLTSYGKRRRASRRRGFTTRRHRGKLGTIGE